MRIETEVKESFMDIKILEEAASRKIREQSPEEAEKFMARIRSNLFDLLCHSDKARAELPRNLSLSEYGGREAVERAIGKAVVNLLALAAVFGVKACGVILRELGFVPEFETSDNVPGDNGSSPHASGSEDVGHAGEKADSEGVHQEPALAPADNAGKGKHKRDPQSLTESSGESFNDGKSEYRQRLDKAECALERTAVWKEIQADRSLDSKRRAELYRHMTALNKQQAAR